MCCQGPQPSSSFLPSCTSAVYPRARLQGSNKTQQEASIESCSMPPSLRLKSSSKSMMWASLGTFSHRVLWWVEHFVFWLIRSLHGAMGMTKSHIIATLGSNYLKTDLFPESSSLFRWRPSLSPFKNHPSSQESRIPIVPPAVFVRR